MNSIAMTPSDLQSSKGNLIIGMSATGKDASSGHTNKISSLVNSPRNKEIKKLAAMDHKTLNFNQIHVGSKQSQSKERKPIANMNLE
jgi:hypothetical protein